MTARHPILDRWLRDGRPEPGPEHLGGCDACRRALAEIDEEASWFPADAGLPGETVDAIRFRLQAETRQAQREAPARRRTWLAAAAMLLFLGIGGAAAYALIGSPAPVTAPAAVPVPAAAAIAVAVPDPGPVAAAVPDAGADPVAAAGPPRRRKARTFVLPPPPAMVERADPILLDARFQSAWRLYRAGQYDEAAAGFDRLLAAYGDGPRRGDLLFWSGRAHLLAGRPAVGRARLEELLRAHPEAWHAPDARVLLDRLASPGR
jgi:TolA-binding protein